MRLVCFHFSRTWGILRRQTQNVWDLYMILSAGFHRFVLHWGKSSGNMHDDEFPHPGGISERSLTLGTDDTGGEAWRGLLAGDCGVVLAVTEWHLLTSALHPTQNHVRHVTALPVPRFLGDRHRCRQSGRRMSQVKSSDVLLLCHNTLKQQCNKMNYKYGSRLWKSRIKVNGEI